MVSQYNWFPFLSCALYFMHLKVLFQPVKGVRTPEKYPSSGGSKSVESYIGYKRMRPGVRCVYSLQLWPHWNGQYYPSSIQEETRRCLIAHTLQNNKYVKSCNRNRDKTRAAPCLVLLTTTVSPCLAPLGCSVNVR